MSARSKAVAKTILASDREARLERALRGLMAAYERRVRSDCTTAEQLERAPWRCAEFVIAEEALRDA